MGLCGDGDAVLGRWALIESSLAPDKTVMLFTLGVLVVPGFYSAWLRSVWLLLAELNWR